MKKNEKFYLGMNDYPTKEQLEKIRNWNISENGILDFIEFIHSIWCYSDRYFKLTGKYILKLELHTGGWSGNEEIIRVFRENIFWLAFWQKSLCGGHYYFRINLKYLKK